MGHLPSCNAYLDIESTASGSPEFVTPEEWHVKAAYYLAEAKKGSAKSEQSRWFASLALASCRRVIVLVPEASVHRAMMETLNATKVILKRFYAEQDAIKATLSEAGDYLNGRNGKSKNMVKAYGLYQQVIAEQSCNPRANYMIGWFHKHGQGECERSLREAQDHFQRAASENYQPAIEALEKLPEWAEEKADDAYRADRYSRAHDWYQEILSVWPSRKKPAFMLGEIFRLGEGGEPASLVRAWPFYLLAKRNGSTTVDTKILTPKCAELQRECERILQSLYEEYIYKPAEERTMMNTLFGREEAKIIDDFPGFFLKLTENYPPAIYPTDDDHAEGSATMVVSDNSSASGCQRIWDRYLRKAVERCIEKGQHRGLSQQTHFILQGLRAASRSDTTKRLIGKILVNVQANKSGAAGPSSSHSGYSSGSAGCSKAGGYDGPAPSYYSPAAAAPSDDFRGAAYASAHLFERAQRDAAPSFPRAEAPAASSSGLSMGDAMRYGRRG